MKNNLRELREKNGRTATDLACICGISKQLLNRYELSKTKMPYSFLKQVSLLFDVTIYDILGESYFEYKGVVPKTKEEFDAIQKYLDKLRG